jgi:glutathione S-transferase
VKLIGMLDSPYVRRVAICMKLAKLDFEHEATSVFRHYDAFRQINPVVKAPTLVLDDGQSLMDSTLILGYLGLLEGAGERLRSFRLTALALAACEKSVQIIYERNLRPVEKQHQPWVDRVHQQLSAAYGELEAALAAQPFSDDPASLSQAAVTVAVSWHFTQRMLPEVVVARDHPGLAAFSAHAERLPVFLATPHG